MRILKKLKPAASALLGRQRVAPHTGKEFAAHAYAIACLQRGGHGGGGAGAVGGSAPAANNAGNGGAGTASSISGSSVIIL